MINLQQTEDGVLLPVKARAGGTKNIVSGTHDGALKVMVTQAPEKGKANQAIVKVLAKSLDIQKSRFTLVSGQTSPNKTFLIADASAKELLAIIEKLIATC